MAINLNLRFRFEKHCPDGMHDWTPIIEGNQTVGLQCLNCPKTVRENMEQSNIIVTDSGSIVERINNHDIPLRDVHSGAHKRKDPRF